LKGVLEKKKDVLPAFNILDADEMKCAVEGLFDPDINITERLLRGMILTEDDRKKADEKAKKKKEAEKKASEDIARILASGASSGGVGGSSSSSGPTLLGKHSKSSSISSLSDWDDDARDQKKARSDRVDAREFKRLQAENIDLRGENGVLRLKVQLQESEIRAHEATYASLQADLSAAQARIQILEAIDSDFASVNSSDSIPSSTFRAMQIA